MSALSDIVQITINRETQAVSQAGFGVPAIISEFATSKTTVPFVRYREYASTTEMTTDGWTTADPEYKAAAIFFSQNPKVSKVVIGRKDSGDASWAAALDAIQIATQDWYTLMIIASQTGTVVFDADFVTGNAIDFTINGTAVTTVNWSTDQATTMGLLKTQIETDIAGSSVDISGAGGRTLVIQIFGQAGVTAISAVVTGGASQATATITYTNEDDYKAVAAWTETQKKLYFVASSSSGIKDGASTTDLAYFLKNTGYDRTVCIYHTSAQGDVTPSYIEAGVPGEALPYDPGSQTWAYKTISGVAAYGLTSAERTAILAKNCMIYTTTGGVNVTEQGKVASGEYIDIMRGLDWLESRLQEEIYSNLVNKRKIPFTDEGISLIQGAIQGVLDEGARKGLLVADSISISVPLASAVGTVDKAARNLPDITFEAILQGAIHTVSIVGTVTV